MRSEGRERGLLDSVRNVGIVIAFLAVLLVLLSIISVVKNLGSSESLTGNIIRIQNGENDTEFNNSIVKYYKNTQCWINSGVNNQDVVVIGDAINGLECPFGEKKEIKGVIKDNCAILYISNEGSVELCSEGSKPDIKINLGGSENSGVIAGYDAPERNYYGYILFFIALIIIVLFWREYEMKVRTGYDIRAEKAYLERKAMKKLNTEEEKPIEKKPISVPRAPFYNEDIEKIKMITEAKLKKSDLEKEELSDIKKNKLISEFNELSENINNSIVLGRLHESRKNYVKLFDVYTKLILLVNKNNRKNLDSVMEYLCNYLGALEKLRSTKREGVEDKMKKEKIETIKPKGEILTMEELEKMKDLIKEKNYTQAKNMFQNENVNNIKIKNVAKNVHKKDKLDEIEVLHDKILKKGVIGISEQDYYRFMMDMSSLRDQLKKKSKTKKKS